MIRWIYLIIFLLFLLSFGTIGCEKKSFDKDIKGNAAEVEKFTESETKNKLIQETSQDDEER